MKRALAVGDRFGRWTIIKKDAGWSRWVARCDCGTEKIIQSGHLFAGQTKSCGCLRDELNSMRATKHGQYRTAEYRTWCAIRRRCHTQSDKSYPTYGGRGIVVCQRWQTSFDAFLADMGARPSDQHSIERRNNDKGYSPDNCYWATKKQQAENRRSNQYVILKGEMITVAEAARRLGIHRSTIRDYALAKGVTRQSAVDHYVSHRAIR